MPVGFFRYCRSVAPCVATVVLATVAGCSDPDMPVVMRVSPPTREASREEPQATPLAAKPAAGEPATKPKSPSKPADAKPAKSTSTESRTTESKSTQSHPAVSKPRESARTKPATVHEAAAVLDVRSIPKLSETRPMRESATTLEYHAKGNVASVAAFYRSELTRLGWKDLSATTDVVETIQYLESVWEKSEFFAKMTFSQGGEPNTVSVTVNMLGNIDARKLPVVDGAESMNSGIPSAESHTCPSDVATVAAKSRELLMNQGWRQFQGFDPPLPANPQVISIDMYQGGVHLMVMVNSHPQFQNGKTVVSYFMLGMLPFDMPAMADAQGMKVDLLSGRYEYWTKGKLPALVDFYRLAYEGVGWKYPENKSAIGTDTAMLVFECDRELRGLVQIRPREEGGMKVAFQRLAVIPASVEAELAAKENASADQWADEISEQASPESDDVATAEAPDFPDVNALVNDALKDVQQDLKQALKANSGVSLDVLDSHLEPAEKVEAEPLVAEDKDGIPVPKNYTSFVSESTRFRRQITATVPATIAEVSAFYDRELAQQGWKSLNKSPARPAKPVELNYTKENKNLIVKLAMADDEVKIEISSRDNRDS